MAIAGYNTVGGSEDFNATNDGDINGPYTVGVGSTITEFHAYLRAFSGTGSNQVFRPLIYEDSSGEPGALIATLAEITVLGTDTTGAWRDLTGLSVTAPTADIWIGLWYGDNDHRYAYDTTGGNPSRYMGALATYSSTLDAPDPWPAASDTPSTQQQSIYVVYTAGGGTNATVTATVATSTASSVAPPKPRPANPFAEINVRM